MLIYWLLLGIFVLGAVIFEERPVDRLPAIPLILASTLAALAIGLRYKVGSDWDPYRILFNEMRYVSISGAILRSDPAYGLLNWIVKRAGWDQWVVNLACGAIFMAGLHRFARRQSSPWLVLAVAVPYLVIVVGMGYNRQATALGFVLLALNAVQDRRFRAFLLYMVLASLFHRSALLLLPIIAVSYSHNRLVTSLLAIAATGLGYMFIVAPEVDTYISRYGGSEQGDIESQGTAIRLLMNIVPALIFFAFRSRLPAHGDYLKVWRNFSLLAIFSLVIFAYFGNNTAIDRLSIYLSPLQLFIFGNLPLVMRGRGGHSRLSMTLILLYAAAIQAVWLFQSSNVKFWIPYRFFPI